VIAAQLIAVIFQIAIVFGFASVLPDVVRPLLVIVALILIPGILTALILHRVNSWQIAGFGIAFGITEAADLGTTAAHVRRG